MDLSLKHNLKSDEIIFFGDSKTDFEATAKHSVHFVLRLHEHNR